MSQHNLLRTLEAKSLKDLFEEGTVSAARQGLDENGIVLIRGLNDLHDDALVRFIGQFGEQYAPSSPRHAGGALDVITYEEEAAGREAGAARWHLDFSFLPTPAKETILYCIEPSDAEVRTHFCSMYDVAARLPELTKNVLRKISAHYEWGHGLPENSLDSFQGTATDSAIHPVMFVNPANGRELLYYCDLKLARFLGLSDKQQADLRALVRSMIDTAESRYIHSWRRGDLLLFDAVGMVHRRDQIATESFRHLKAFFTRFRFEHTP